MTVKTQPKPNATYTHREKQEMQMNTQKLETTESEEGKNSSLTYYVDCDTWVPSLCHQKQTPSF